MKQTITDTSSLPQDAYKNQATTDMPGEVWHLLQNSESGPVFWISSYGRVKKITKHKDTSASVTIIQLKVNNERYLFFTMNKRTVLVHDAVALSFIYNEYGLPEKTHVNGIKTDNRKENITWCEVNSDDLINPYIVGDYKKIPVLSKGTPIVKLLNGDRLAVYPTIRDAAAANSLSPASLSAACTSRFPFAGYMWVHLREYLKSNNKFTAQAKFITNSDKHIWIK